MASKNQFLDAVASFRRNPALFVEVLLEAEPTDYQAEAMMAVADGERRVSIRSGRRVGKTTLMSWLSLWFEMTHTDARTIVTAPSSGQLEDAYIPNFRQWAQKLPDDLYDMWDIKAQRFDFMAGVKKGYENFVTVRTARADSPESMQGINATNVLVLVDEAAGVDDVNFEALSGSLATGESGKVSGSAHMVLTGNPNRTTGYFYDTHHKLKDFWYTLHVSSEDSVLVGQEWIEEKRRDWGRDSDPYRVHVLGEFPTGEEDTLIPVHLVEGAVGRDVELSGAIVWGVDPARFGSDRSALCKRKGNGLLEPVRTWRNLDTMEVAGRIKHEWDTTPMAMRPNEILVDSIGIGSGVVDRLRELTLPVRGINVSESPALSGTYNRQRDELWDKVKQWLEGRDVYIPPQEQNLREELVTPKLGFTSSGKMKVESKKDMRSRGKGSPDCADALCLTFASTAATASGRRYPTEGPLKRNIKGVI